MRACGWHLIWSLEWRVEWPSHYYCTVAFACNYCSNIKIYLVLLQQFRICSVINQLCGLYSSVSAHLRTCNTGQRGISGPTRGRHTRMNCWHCVNGFAFWYIQICMTKLFYSIDINVNPGERRGGVGWGGAGMAGIWYFPCSVVRI